MGSIIMISSGKGGAGKSTVSAYLGHALCMQGKKTIIIELDVGLRSLDIILGLESSACFDLYDILSGHCEPYKVIRTAEDFHCLQFIPAPQDIGADIDMDRFIALCVALKRNYDYVLIDSPAGVGELFKIAAKSADAGFIVSTPDAVCVRDAELVTAILEDTGIENQRLIINRLNHDQFRRSSLRDLDEVIDRVGVQLIGVIPESQEIITLSSHGKPLPADCLAAQVFTAIAKRLLGHSVPLLVD